MLTALFASCSEDASILDPTVDSRSLNATSDSGNSLFSNTAMADSTDHGGCDDMDEDFEMDMCFEFVFPITLILPDGKEVQVNSEEELDAAIDAYYEANPESFDFPTFAYPISLNLADGSTAEVNSDEELEAAFESCEGEESSDDESEGEDEEGFDEGDEAECFTINYPVTIITPDGVSSSVNSDEELDEIVDQYYEANPESEEDPTFAYPVSLTLTDGTTQDVNSDEDFEALFEGCEGDSEGEYGDEGEEEDSEENDGENDGEDDEEGDDQEEGDDEGECFAINYPVSVITPDGVSTSVNSDEELDTILDQYYEANPESEEDPTFAYPILLTLTDGTTQEVGSDEELEALFEACEGEEDDESDENDEEETDDENDDDDGNG